MGMKLLIANFAVVWDFRCGPGRAIKDSALSLDGRVPGRSELLFQKALVLFASSTRTLSSSSSFAESFASRSSAQFGTEHQSVS